MSEQDQAMETVLEFARRRPPRELMVAVLMAVRMDKKEETKHPGKEGWKEMVGVYTDWADKIIKYCRENPPK